MEFITGFSFGLLFGIPIGWVLYETTKGIIHVAKTE